MRTDAQASAATADSPIDRYLARLDGALSGPGGAKRDLLAEARDHLHDAAEAYVADG